MGKTEKASSKEHFKVLIKWSHNFIFPFNTTNHLRHIKV